MAGKLLEMGDVRLSVAFKKCYLQGTASFPVAAKSFSQVQTILCHEVGGKTESSSSRWRAFLSLWSFFQQGSRVFDFAWVFHLALFCSCVAFWYAATKGCFLFGWEILAFPSPPKSANCFVLLAKSFFVVPFLPTSSALLNCIPPNARLLTTLPFDFSP